MKSGKKKVILGVLVASGTIATVNFCEAFLKIMKVVHTKKPVSKRFFGRFSGLYYYVDDDQPFIGAAVGALCCSMRLDLGKLEIKEDCYLELGALMSAVTIIVPKNVNVRLENKSYLSGSMVMKEEIPGAPTLTIHGFSSMGAIVILESNLDEAVTEEPVLAKVTELIGEATEETVEEAVKEPVEEPLEATTERAEEMPLEEAPVSLFSLEDTASGTSDRLSEEQVQSILNRITTANEDKE